MTSSKKPKTSSREPEATSKKPEASSRKQANGDWTRMWFKTNKVWVAVNTQGEPITREGKVLIKYQLKQDYEYRVNRSSVRPLDSPPPKMKTPAPKKAKKKKSGKKASSSDFAAELDESALTDKICIFTDGASSGNPGPAGIGVLLRYGRHEKEISEFLGDATNNIAELMAIKAGLLAVKDRTKPVRLFTDSQYAFGLLVKNWKPRKNQEIVDSIKQTMRRFKDLKIIKVKGHAGLPGNEKADLLATTAIKKAQR